DWDMTRNRLLAAVLAALAVAGVGQAAGAPLPQGGKIARLEARPGRIALSSPLEYAQLVVTGVGAAGERFDVTRLVKLEAPAVVKVGPTGVVRPAADGAGTMKVRLVGQALDIPVEVKGQKDAPQVSFVQDVMPVLGRLGCNAGTCHGAESGKG